jgi:hypothetical protein
MRRIICVIASLLTLAACASEPRRPPSNLDPSSPDAPEAPPAALPSTLSEPVVSAPTTPAQGHAGHGGAARDGGTPTAPMGAGHAHHGGAAAQPSPDAGTAPSGHEHHGASAAPTARDAGTASGPMSADHAHATPSRDAGTTTVYTCPMHPEVRAEQPGRCPKCGMKLVPEQPETGGATDAGQPPSGHDDGAHP